MPTDDPTALRLQTSDAQATLVGLLALAEAHRVSLTDLASAQATLEDVFLALAGRTYEQDEPTADSHRPPAKRGRRR